MKQFVLIAFLLCTRLCVIAQEDSAKQIVFTKVETDAVFDGGQNAWVTFLKKNLKPGIPFANRAPAGRYVVLIRFLVNIDGTLSDIEAETRHGYGMEKEAIRVLKLSPPWKPATQNDRPVKAIKRQPFMFVVTDAA